MKPILLISLVLWFTSSRAQTITPEQAKDYQGKKVTVCGEVKSTYTSEKGTVFLNLGATYPNQVFSVVIYSADAAKFEGDPATLYEGKNVCVTGMVKLYKGKPEIEVSTGSQIEIKL